MRCAVLGSPIAHSLSPAMHRAAYRVLGLDWSYGAFDVQEGELTEPSPGAEGADPVRAVGDDDVPRLDDIEEVADVALPYHDGAVRDRHPLGEQREALDQPRGEDREHRNAS